MLSSNERKLLLVGGPSAQAAQHYQQQLGSSWQHVATGCPAAGTAAQLMAALCCPVCTVYIYTLCVSSISLLLMFQVYLRSLPLCRHCLLLSICWLGLVLRSITLSDFAALIKILQGGHITKLSILFAMDLVNLLEACRARTAHLQADLTNDQCKADAIGSDAVIAADCWPVPG